jgi:hypothetical protein
MYTTLLIDIVEIPVGRYAAFCPEDMAISVSSNNICMLIGCINVSRRMICIPIELIVVKLKHFKSPIAVFMGNRHFC